MGSGAAMALSIVGSLLALAGCAAGSAASEDAPAEATEEVVTGSVANPLATGTVQWINGTYTTCLNRSGSWSARVSGTATMDNAALTVVKNDTACKLTITGVVADQAYAAAPTIALGASFLGVPALFGVGAAQFPGNARLETTSYASDFQITFVYSGSDPVPVDSTVSGGYATVQSSVATTVVPASTYTMDVSNLRFQADVLQLVVGLTGQAVLVDGVIAGASYVIDAGTLAAAPTYAQVATAYTNAVLTQKTITGANPTIQAAEFSVLTLSLLGSTQVRNVIVKRTVAGVSAYQILRVTFIS